MILSSTQNKLTLNQLTENQSHPQYLTENSNRKNLLKSHHPIFIRFPVSREQDSGKESK